MNELRQLRKPAWMVLSRFFAEISRGFMPLLDKSDAEAADQFTMWGQNLRNGGSNFHS
jgi:hypothetical protein